jgi:hypothetical protein
MSTWKDAVRAATTANITLSGTQTIDGVAVIANDRMLVRPTLGRMAYMPLRPARGRERGMPRRELSRTWRYACRKGP